LYLGDFYRKNRSSHEGSVRERICRQRPGQSFASTSSLYLPFFFSIAITARFSPAFSIQASPYHSISIKFSILIKYYTQTSNCYFFINCMILPCKIYKFATSLEMFSVSSFLSVPRLNSYSGKQHSHF